MSLEKQRTLMKAFIESQFNYSRTLNKKINHIHKRESSIVYYDYKSSFNELLDKDDSLKIHQKLSKVYQLKFICTYLQQY